MQHPLITREHGTWAMLLVPLLVGLGVAGHGWGRGMLFALAALSFFLARYPMALLVKGRNSGRSQTDRWVWMTIYLTLAMAFTAPLVLYFHRWHLLPLGALAVLLLAIYLIQVDRRREMTVWGEFLGIAGLTLSAPASYYVATDVLGTTALLLWLINLLYFGGTVFYIKLKVREQPRQPPPPSRQERLSRGRVTLAYHVLAIASVGALSLSGWVPAAVLVAFAPCLAKAVRGVLAWGGRPHMLRLGLTEVAHAVAFGTLLILAYRWS
jgi:hypothetical protein